LPLASCFKSIRHPLDSLTVNTDPGDPGEEWDALVVGGIRPGKTASISELAENSRSMRLV